MNKRNFLKCTVMMTLALGMWGQAFAEDSTATYELAPIVVTANRVPEKLVDTKADISVVTRKQIENLHLQTVEDTLREVPGTQFLNYGSNGLNANLSGIRINGSKDVVILIDGVRITDFQGANNSGYMYASILNNMDNIERVEVLRGSAAVKYGSGAKGGVINIITRKIDGTKQSIDFSKGTGGKESYKFDSMGKLGKFGYNAYYNRTLIGDTKDGDGKKWPGHTRTNSGGAKFTYDFNDNNHLSMYYDEVSSRYRGKDFVYKNKYHGDYKTHAFTIQDDWQIDKHWSNMLSYRSSKIKTNYFQDYENSQSKYGISSDLSYDFVTEQVRFNDDWNDLVFGLDYSYGKNHLPLSTGQFTDDGDMIQVRNHTQKNYSYFIQEDWKFLPRWTLSGGLRYDRPETDKYSADIKNHRSSSYKLSYDITDKDTVFAGRNEFYILPGLDVIYAAWADPDDDSGTIKDHGNRHLKPAEGRTSTIGYTHKFNDASAFTLNWFETKDSSVIGYSDESDRYENFDHGIARGWNAQLLYQLGSHWNFDLGWAHLYQNVPGDNFRLGYYPKDKMTFAVMYNRDKWNAGVDGFYFIRRKNPNYSGARGWPSDKYDIFNLSVNYSPNKDLTFYTRVENLFNKLWAEHTDVIWNHKEGNWYSMPGRLFTFGIKYKF